MWEWKAHGFGREPEIHAWSWLPAPAPQAGHSGPLAGLRFGVKDVLDVCGMPTSHGCTGLQAPAAFWDATVVAQLRAAGAEPIGKTVTAEFAFMHPGPTRNPRNVAHTPGGSSSGSAAAVAAGMVDFALGTQTGGSIIRPAAYCGVVGFKPSFGLVQRQGMLVTSETLDTIGWFASSVPLSARLLQCITGQRVPQAQLPQRVAVLRGWPRLDARVEHILQSATAHLEQEGVQLLPLEPLAASMPRLVQLHRIIGRYELARGMLSVQQRHGHLLSSSMQAAIDEGLAIDVERYLQAQQERRSMDAQLHAMLEGVDCILTPSAQDFAPLGLQSTGSSLPLRPWSLLGWPCLHLPCARQTDTGLPQGVQLVGRRWQDAALHAFAHALAQTLPALQV